MEVHQKEGDERAHVTITRRGTEAMVAAQISGTHRPRWARQMHLGAPCAYDAAL
jgi:hypothetical protein